MRSVMLTIPGAPCPRVARARLALIGAWIGIGLAACAPAGEELEGGPGDGGAGGAGTSSSATAPALSPPADGAAGSPLSPRDLVPAGVEEQLSVATGFGAGNPGGWVDLFFPAGQWIGGCCDLGPADSGFEILGEVEFCFPDAAYLAAPAIELTTASGDRLPIEVDERGRGQSAFTDTASGQTLNGTCVRHQLPPEGGMGRYALWASRAGETLERYFEVGPPSVPRIMLRAADPWLGFGMTVPRGQTVEAMLAGYPPGPVAVHVYRVLPDGVPDDPEKDRVLGYLNTIEGLVVDPQGEARFEVATRADDAPGTYYLVTNPPDTEAGQMSFFVLE